MNPQRSNQFKQDLETATAGDHLMFKIDGKHVNVTVSHTTQKGVYFNGRVPNADLRYRFILTTGEMLDHRNKPSQIEDYTYTGRVSERVNLDQRGVPLVMRMI